MKILDLILSERVSFEFIAEAWQNENGMLGRLFQKEYKAWTGIPTRTETTGGLRERPC